MTRLFNSTTEEELEYRTTLLKELFKFTGDNIYRATISLRLWMSYKCCKNFYANYDCIIIDVCKVKIGDNVFFGPRVGVYTTGHPIDADIRNNYLEFGKPITIGGQNIPNNLIAVGNPCKVLRKITDEDKKYWKDKRKEYFEI